MHTDEINGKKALYFDGNDYLTKATLTNCPSGDFTFVTVVNMSGTANYPVFMNGPSSGFVVRLDASARPQVVKDGIANIANANTALGTSAWSVVTVAYKSSTGVCRFWKNGVRDGGGTSSQTFSTGVGYIGQRGGSANFFNGYMADLWLYNRELSGDEIDNIHQDIKNFYGLTVATTTTTTSSTTTTTTAP